MFISTIHSIQRLYRNSTSDVGSKNKTKHCPINVSCQKCKNRKKRENFKTGKYKNTFLYFTRIQNKYTSLLNQSVFKYCPAPSCPVNLFLTKHKKIKTTKILTLDRPTRPCVSSTLPIASCHNLFYDEDDD